MATVYHKRTTAALISQIGISLNTKCDNTVGLVFVNQVTINSIQIQSLTINSFYMQSFIWYIPYMYVRMLRIGFVGLLHFFKKAT